MVKYAMPGSNRMQAELIYSGLSNYNQESNRPVSSTREQDDEDHYVCWHCGYSECDGNCIN